MGTCAYDCQNINLEQCNRGMFFFVAAIGKGGFGHVWKVKLKKTMEVFALKEMSKARILSMKSLNLVLNERHLLQKINHKFIISMISSFQDRDNLYLLMEHLNGGDLRHYLNSRHQFSENQVKFIIRCVIEALKYLHSMGIMHRDIKPQNIVFEESGYCRITDFGVSKQFTENNAKNTSGTLGYMAPEVVFGQNHSFAVDHFAVGVVCYELMTGRRPYEGSAKLSIKDQILSKQISLPEGYKQFSKQMINFTNRLLQRRARDRLGFGGIDEIINHPWLKIQDNQYAQFIEKRLKPEFVPFRKVKHYEKVIEQFQETELDRQNALLLKQNLFQQLFRNYDYDLQKERKRSLNETKQIDMIEEDVKIKQNLAKVKG